MNVRKLLPRSDAHIDYSFPELVIMTHSTLTQVESEPIQKAISTSENILG